MSMRTLLQQVRSALTSHEPLTDLVSAQKITFARRPQRDELPGITLSLGNVVYEETKQSEVSAISYRVDVIVYGRSADETTEIHDAIKQAFLNADSNDFTVRLLDERYFVDADDIHSGYVSARWQMAPGPSQTSPVTLSPAMQGYDKMKINYDFKVSSNSDTDLSTTEQVYYFNFASTSGSDTHVVNLPSVEANLGKVYTFLLGGNIDNNTKVQLTVNGLDRIEGAGTYDLNRGGSSVSIVGVKTSATAFGWHIYAYHGLHD